MFVLYFIDGTIFKGNSFPKSQWLDAPDKEIRQMEYYIGNVIFIFNGFKQYNHLIENVGFGANGILKWFLMARTDKETFITTFDNTRKENYNNVCEIGQEYGNQILSGWKEGKANNDPIVYIKNRQNERIRVLYPKDTK